jgi:UrcA family protein
MNIQLEENLAQTAMPAAPAATQNSPSIETQEIPMSTYFHNASIVPTIIALMAGLAALAPIGSHADERATNSERVSIVGLNPNSVDGAKKIYARLSAAAWRVCGESTFDIDVMYRGGPSDCVHEALAHAVRDVHSVQLSQLYVKNNGIKMAKLYDVTPDILTASK